MADTTYYHHIITPGCFYLVVILIKVTLADDAVFRRLPVPEPVSLHRSDPIFHSFFVGPREYMPPFRRATTYTTCLWHCYLMPTTAMPIGGQQLVIFHKMFRAEVVTNTA